ncbi:MAG: hypothetical protein KZQ83_00395 [gamma proteobacterium symbiont of Taylorina sp.]|nr:hypothetical protein [gamma proteobacterium symbiont of Taylorina sp.]
MLKSRRRPTKQSNGLSTGIITSETILSTSIEVAISPNGVKDNPEFKNVSINYLLDLCKTVKTGKKDGAYFIRSETSDSNKRSNKTTAWTAHILILDVDSGNGKDAPDPKKIHKTLKDLGINHLMYRSYSHGIKGNRYRILFITDRAYQREELKPTVEYALKLCGGEIANVSENCTWSQPWYLPRKPESDTSDFTYLEYTDGKALTVVEAPESPEPDWDSYTPKTPDNLSNGQISPIKAFNEQYPIEHMLSLRGDTKVGNRWLFHDSDSGVAGISIKDGKMFSFHGSDPLSNGNAHDSFDLFMLTGRCK